MRRIALIALLALAVGAQAASPGRTDGLEGSEYGTGGYKHGAQYGRFYTEGFLGAAPPSPPTLRPSSPTARPSGSSCRGRFRRYG